MDRGDSVTGYSRFLQASAERCAGAAADSQTMRRIVRLCGQAVETMRLNLAGISVLTEAATGPFAVTALIAALAGAERVVAVTRDSRYGSGAEAIAQVRALLTTAGIDGRVEFHTGDASDAATDCALVTNLGFVRPIGRALLGRVNPHAAVALMWEPWEFRGQDIDLETIEELGIALIGTNERHPHVRTFEFLGPTVGRLAFEAGIEIVGSNLVVIGSEPFGPAIADWLRAAGAHVHAARVDNWPEALTPSSACDALILAEHRDHRPIDGAPGSGDALARIAESGAPVLRLCGALDRAAAERAEVAIHPASEVAPGIMTVTTGYAGPRPVIDLHCAGLRAGADVVVARRRGLSVNDAIAEAVANGYGVACGEVIRRIESGGA
jgi:hypothetical protein